MKSTTNQSSVKALHASRYNLPHSNLTVDEARERLNKDFGDMISVHKAF